MRQMTVLIQCLMAVLYGVMEGCSEADACRSCIDNNITTGGLDDAPCGEMVFQVIAWEDPTPLGIPAKDLFDSVQGSCTTSLAWDATAIGDETNPPRGESNVTVTLGLDPATVVIGQYEIPDGRPECGDLQIMVNGNAAIASADGTFNDNGEVTLLYGETSGLSYIKLEKTISALGGTFSINSNSLETMILSYDFETPGVACVGEIVLNQASHLGNGTATSAIGAIGSWSSTGCPLGKIPIDLRQEGDDGLSLIKKIGALWSSRTLPAIWENGAKTFLNLQISGLPAAACIDQSMPEALYSVIDIPITVTYETADNQLALRSVETHLAASMGMDGTIRATSIQLSDNRACEGEADSLSYGFGDCTTLSGITVQIGMGWDQNLGWNISDGGVMIYEYNQDTEPFVGAAGRVRILSLNQTALD